jgi:hypothetical protein
VKKNANDKRFKDLFKDEEEKAEDELIGDDFDGVEQVGQDGSESEDENSLEEDILGGTDDEDDEVRCLLSLNQLNLIISFYYHLLLASHRKTIRKTGEKESSFSETFRSRTERID